MATMTLAPGVPTAQQQSKAALNTLPDPRRSDSPHISRSNTSSPHHPELSNEVATLSNKLIHAINHQTDLDDTLNETRQQLQTARERILDLERAVQEHNSLLTNGILIQRSDVEADTLRLKTSLAEERKAKYQVEKEKKSMEQELESLTSALFEEANEMVSNARKDARNEREAIERRNEQLQSQLNDTELLLASQQEQLLELKSSMQERNDHDNQTTASSAPSTPALDHNEHMSRVFEVLSTSAAVPSPPTTYTTLLQPVLRTDVQAFEDFQALLELSRKSQPSSRVNSGTYSGLAGLGLSTLAHREASPMSARLTPNASTTSLVNPNNHPSSPATPTVPHSNNSSVSSRDIPLTTTPLKETSFYKRILSEDLEPTLRLDLAPGLSWLARRGVINAMIEGKLVVEPMPSSARLYLPPCSLCGEQGRGEKRARRHRFRTSESDNAQRYPLCDFCTNRVRSSCDFLGFLRLIKDGHWRTDGTEAENLAWEESVRLRERMFWSRVGGGVIPAFLKTRDQSPRQSTEEESINQQAPQSAISHTNSVYESNKPEQPSPLAQESSAESTPPPSNVASNEDSYNAVRGRLQGLERSNQQDAKVAERPLAKYQRRISSDSNSTTPTLSRTTTLSRGVSRGDRTGRPSVAQTVAQRAAMFDRPASDATEASRQLQDNLQASVQASLKQRSPSGGGIQSIPREHPPQAVDSHEHDAVSPLSPQSSNLGNGDTIPGSFNF